jgi:acyl-CoA thioesterase YciA
MINGFCSFVTSSSARTRARIARRAAVRARANLLDAGRVHTYADGMSERVPAIKVMMMPKDTNAHGTIFGGVILSNIDLAAGVEAFKVASHLYVTKAMREVEFHEPVFTGDVVSFFTSTVRVGRTSVTVRVEVEAQRWGWDAAGRHVERGKLVKVTEAEVILVAVDAHGRPIPIRPEPVQA